MRNSQLQVSISGNIHTNVHCKFFCWVCRMDKLLSVSSINIFLQSSILNIFAYLYLYQSVLEWQELEWCPKKPLRVIPVFGTILLGNRYALLRPLNYVYYKLTICSTKIYWIRNTRLYTYIVCSTSLGNSMVFSPSRYGLKNTPQSQKTC